MSKSANTASPVWANLFAGSGSANSAPANVVALLKTKARALKRHALTVYFAARDPRTPILVRALALCIAAYAFSPIDLIPDFIPVLGYLDDVILVPIGIYFTLKLIPPPVIEQCRTQARNWIDERRARPRNYVAAAVIVLLWLGALWLAWRWASPYVQGASS